jgi:hypothetical protein
LRGTSQGWMGMVPITSGVFYWVKNDWCQSPQEGLLMSYGKTLKLGF